MNDKAITKPLLRQYQASWKMLRDAIDNVTDERWHNGKGKWFFSLNAYHIVETMDFYNGNDPDNMKWGGRAGFEWRKGIDRQTEILPKITKGIVLAYLDDMEKDIASKLGSLKLEEVLAKDKFHWFDSILEKYLYLLRHNMHHIGELIRTLREWELPLAKWT